METRWREKRAQLGWTLAILAALTLLVGGCSSGDDSNSSSNNNTLGTPARTGQASASASSLEETFVKVVDRVSPSVVQISTNQGLGSGVIYDDKGDIVTNNHVIGNASTFQVTLADNTNHRATRVGAYPPEDLAVIRLEGVTPAPAVFGDSSKLQVGQFAFAIGNPLGLRSSVTQGVISSLGRTVSEGPGGGVISSAVQTSAPINPGNSGGALVDIDAQVVGIPTLAALDPELGGTAAPGIGFAIPSNTAKRIADQLIKNGQVTRSGRAYLGVSVATGVGGAGVVVAGVQKGGPADKAGLRPRSVIVAVNDQPVRSTEDLATVLAQLRPGQKVTLKVVEPDGTQRTITVTLGELPASAAGG
jgi:S1-C subfamily serine protease